MTSFEQYSQTFVLEQDLLIYDQHIAMGGKGSMLEWEKRNLVNKDHIHFLRKGYQEQGELLYLKLAEIGNELQTKKACKSSIYKLWYILV